MDAIGISVGSGKSLPASAQIDYANGQVVAIGAAAAQTQAFMAQNTVVTLRATVNCWFSLGGTASAHVAGSDYLPANTTWMLKIPVGAILSFIQDSVGGWVSIMPATNPGYFPLLLDAVSGAAGAYSLRKLTNAYTGPCVNVRRSTDNATTNIGFTASGDFDAGTFNAFIGAGQGYIATWYDQSGNGNNATQATAASQPQLVTGIAALNGRAALLFTQAQPQFLVLPNAASLNMPFLTGGFISAVVNPTQAPTATRILWTTQSSLAERISINTAQNIIVASAATTTVGLWWPGTALSLSSHQIDVQYSAASLANIPVTTFDAAVQTMTNATQPVGTIVIDTGSLIGGNGGNAWPGYIAEMLIWKSQPAPAPVRSNQKAYWGTP